MENITAFLQWVVDNKDLMNEAWPILMAMIVPLAGAVIALWFKYKNANAALHVVGNGIAQCPTTAGKETIKDNIKGLKLNAAPGVVNAIDKMVRNVDPQKGD